MVRDGICGEQAHGLKNSYSRFILNLCCSLPIINPCTKFHPNRNKNTEDENFRYWSVLVGWLGKSKNVHRPLKLFPCCLQSHISPHTKFHSNRTKNTEVENFRIWSVLVGRAGRLKKSCSHFKHSESIQRLTNGLCTKFKPNRMKIG